MYIWYITNKYHGHGIVGQANVPLGGDMAPSDASMLIPTWEAFLAAS